MGKGTDNFFIVDKFIIGQFGRKEVSNFDKAIGFSGYEFGFIEGREELVIDNNGEVEVDEMIILDIKI